MISSQKEILFNNDSVFVFFAIYGVWITNLEKLFICLYLSKSLSLTDEYRYE
jgi:hypothetical protein